MSPANHVLKSKGRLSAGFTLLELLVVIVIIGLLAAYVGPKYFAQLDKSEVTIAKAQMAAFEKALDNYRLDVGRFPAATATEGLHALLEAPPAEVEKWNGPYLKEVPKDPWGKDYIYTTPGGGVEFVIRSPGLEAKNAGGGAGAGASSP